MEVNTAGSVTGASNNQTIYLANKNKQNVSIDDFFTLLATQLQNQSMFNPVQDTEFMSQMAQFSSLQQMQELTKTFSTMMSVSLVGKQVSAQVVDAANNNAIITGVVDGVEMNNGKSFLCIGEYRIDPACVTAITK